MATKSHIETGESNLAIFYRLVLPSGDKLIWMATPLDADTALRVIGNVTVEYTLFVSIQPAGVPWMFLRGFVPLREYLLFHTQLPETVADIYAALMPLISKLAPADQIAQAADAWWSAHQA